MVWSSGDIGLFIGGEVGFCYDNSLYTTGQNKGFGYWRTDREDSLLEYFDSLYFPLENVSGDPAGNPAVFDKVTGGNYISNGGSWYDAGTLIPKFSDAAIQQRALFLHKDDYVSTGATPSPTGDMTLYARFIPSGNIIGKDILAKYDEDPAQFVMGCGLDGKYYVRVDGRTSIVPDTIHLAPNDTVYNAEGLYGGMLRENNQTYNLHLSVDDSVEGSQPEGGADYIWGNCGDQPSAFESCRTEFGFYDTPAEFDSAVDDEVVFRMRAWSEYNVVQPPYAFWGVRVVLKLPDWTSPSHQFTMFINQDLYEHAFSIPHEFNNKTQLDGATLELRVYEHSTSAKDWNIYALELRFGANYDEGSVEHIVKSNKTFDRYDIPTQLVGTYGGDSKLRIYINGELEDISPAFTRSIPEDRHDDEVLVGKSKNAFLDKGFAGWIDEVGIANKPLPIGTGNRSEASVINLYENIHYLSKHIDDDPDRFTPCSGAYNEAYSLAFDTSYCDYIQFIVESGNLASVSGGAYSTDLWGLSDYAVSSQIYFDLTDTQDHFYSLDHPYGNKESVLLDVWTQHETTHSGAYLSASITKHQDAASDIKSVNWYSDEVWIPSGNILDKVSLSGNYQDNPAEYKKADIDNQVINFHVRYPESLNLYDGRFKIFSSQLDIDGWCAPIPTGNSLDLYTIGGVPTIATGGIDLFIDGNTNEGQIDLFLENFDGYAPLFIGGVGGKIESLIRLLVYGHGAASAGIDLYIEGGHDPSIPANYMPLFIANKFRTVTNTIPLYIEGGHDPSIPANFMPLFIASKFYSNFAHLYIPGLGGVTDTVDLFTQSHGVSSSGTDLFVDGVYKSHASLNLFTKAVDPASTRSSIPLNIWSASQSGIMSNLDLFVQSPAPTGAPLSNMNLFMDTLDLSYNNTSNMPLFLQTTISGGGTGVLAGTDLFIENKFMAAGREDGQGWAPLFMDSPESIKYTASMNLFIQRQPSDAIPLFVKTEELTSSGSIPLYISKALTVSSGVNLAIPYTIGRPTKGLNLHTDGF